MADRLNNNNATVIKDRTPYETPDFTVCELAIITLGGTIGTGDSGNVNTQSPRVVDTGGRSSGLGDDDPYDDWDDDFTGSRGGGGG